ncbi:MAG: hypothetical protein KC503_47525, partial [Myxococcales bacterium]|nr:hypothetical protein [Myxococcales bacterium]
MSRACARQVEPLAEARDAEHLASCAQCRAEAAALDLLAFDAAEPPAPLDELSRRRTLDALLSAYDAGATGGELVEGAGAPLSRRRYRRVALVAATAAAAAIGLAVLVWRTRPAPDAPRQTSVAARSGGSASGGSASGSSSGGSSSGG